MSSAALIFAPVGPASAGRIAAAPGGEAVDVGFFSGRVGELLKAGTAQAERPSVKTVAPTLDAGAVSSVAADTPQAVEPGLALFDDAGADEAETASKTPAFPDEGASLDADDVTTDAFASAELSGLALQTAPAEPTQVAPAPNDVLSPNAVPQSPVSRLFVAGLASATADHAPLQAAAADSARSGEVAKSPANEVFPSQAVLADASLPGREAELSLPADLLAAASSDKAQPLPEAVLKAAKAALTDIRDAASPVEAAAPSVKTSEPAIARPQASTIISQSLETPLAKASVGRVSIQARRELTPSAGDGVASPEPAQNAPSTTKAELQATPQVATAQTAEDTVQKAMATAAATDLTRTLSKDLDVAAEPAEAPKPSDLSEASSTKEGLPGPDPVKPLRHGDRAAVSRVAVDNQDQPALGLERSNVDKSVASEPAMAQAAKAAPLADSAGSVAPPAEAADPGAVSAATSQDAPAKQAAPLSDRTAPTSHLSHATIETTAHLAAQIARRLDGRATRFDMVLTPEDLGRVDVSLEIGADGQLAARLAFDNPAAAAELRGRADELRRQLQDAGFQVAGDALDFSQRDPSAGGGAFERQQQRNALFSGGARIAREADAPPVPAPGAWTNLARTPDRVDLKV